jgi:hypothetical protein
MLLKLLGAAAGGTQERSFPEGGYLRQSVSFLFQTAEMSFNSQSVLNLSWLKEKI